MKKPKLKKTQAQYAQEYGVSPRTIRNWLERGYPLDDPEKVAELEATQKNSNRIRAAAQTVHVDATSLSDEQLQNPPDLAHAKLYQLILVCRRLAHNIAVERGRVISKEEVKAGVMRVGGAVKSRLLSLPGEMPGRLAGCPEHEIQKRLFEWVHETLTELSNSSSALYQP